MKSYQPSDLEALLRTILPPPLPGECIETRYIPPTQGRQIVRKFYGSASALIADLPRFRNRFHCYYGVALRQGRGGTAADASRAQSCWADVDTKLWSDTTDPKGAAIAAIEGFALRPSVVVDSGGGYQPYWALAEPLDLWTDDARTRLETINTTLARAVCGPDRKPDAVHDVARILRLPGTLNLKPEYGEPRPVQIVWLEAERRYTLDELGTSLRQRAPWAFQATTRRATRPVAPSEWALSPTPPTGLRERAAQGRIRHTTLGLLDSTGPVVYPSASEADAAIAAGLIGAGLSESETYTLIISSARGQDAWERKGQRWAEVYWARTIGNAAAYVGPVVEHPGGLRVRYTGTASRGIRTIPAQEVAPWPS